MLLEYQNGNIVEGNAYLEAFVEALPLLTIEPRYDLGSAALFIPVAARITGVMGHLHIAEVAVATVLSAASATPLVARLARLGLALMVVLQG